MAGLLQNHRMPAQLQAMDLCEQSGWNQANQPGCQQALEQLLLQLSKSLSVHQLLVQQSWPLAREQTLVPLSESLAVKRLESLAAQQLLVPLSGSLVVLATTDSSVKNPIGLACGSDWLLNLQKTRQGPLVFSEHQRSSIRH
jgi:hypothetical protein